MSTSDPQPPAPGRGPSRRGRLVSWLEARLNLTEIFSFITTFGLAYGDIDTRRPLRDAVHDAFRRPHPVYVRWPHILGILAFVVFLFQGVTGMFLAFYYQPSPESAYDSFLVITRDANLGWYIHQMHAWGSHILIGLLVLRLCRFIFSRAYSAPRELVWIIGVGLTLMAIYIAVTGIALPWDQEAYWSFVRASETLRQLPVIGAVVGFFIGGFDMGRFLLPRLYVLHIMALPGAMLALFYLHFATIRRIGLSRLQGDVEPERPLYPDHILNLLTVLVVLFGVILTASVLLPSLATGPADPYDSFIGARPPWYLLPAAGMIELLPGSVAGALMVLLLALLTAVPFLDRVAEPTATRRLAVRLLLVALAGGVLWLGFVGRGLGA